jgi:hypothetical protein
MLVLAIFTTPALADNPTPGTNGAGKTRTGKTVTKVPLEQPKQKTKALGLAKNPPAAKPTAKPAKNVDPIDQKVLILASDGTEADLPAIQQALDYIGVPYTVFKAAVPPPADLVNTDRLTALLSDSALHSYYQGVILTNDSLGYTANGSWLSALSTAEWTALANWEIKFGIRQINWYSYPNPNLGLAYPLPGVDTTTTPISATFTTAGTVSGQSIFGSYVNTANPLPIQNAYTYLTTINDPTTYPIMVDASGHALGAVRNFPDGRQMLSLTFDSSASQTHNLVLSYGLVNWVTKGLFLGERRIYLTAQPDDIFLGDTIWEDKATNQPPACGTNVEATTLNEYRLTGADLNAFVAWQKSAAVQNLAPLFRLELPFNGFGNTSAYLTDPSVGITNDTLTPALIANKNEFNWVSHTYDHTELDNTATTTINYSFTYNELSLNKQNASQLNYLPNGFSGRSLVTPMYTGLTNTQALSAIYNFGIRYMVTDTSRVGYNNPAPNIGFYNSGTYNGKSYNLFMLPRHPVNLYFNVTTPTQWLAEDNCLYPVGANGHINTYADLLDRESSQLLNYLLRGDMDPLMFHQANMRAYDGTHSLLSDLVDATLAKYKQYFKLPVVSSGGPVIPSTDPLCAGANPCKQGAEDRLAYNMSKRTDLLSAGITASVVPGASITLKATKAARVSLTGLPTTTNCASCSTPETYGGQTIVYVTLKAGQSVTLPIK